MKDNDLALEADKKLRRIPRVCVTAVYLWDCMHAPDVRHGILRVRPVDLRPEVVSWRVGVTLTGDRHPIELHFQNNEDYEGPWWADDLPGFYDEPLRLGVGAHRITTSHGLYWETYVLCCGNYGEEP